MKASDIRELTDEEIREELDVAREELMNLRFQQATGELVDFSQIRIIRRDVARYKTVLNERKRELSAGGEA